MTMSAWTLPIAIVMSTCNMCSSLPCTQYELLLLVPVLSVVVMVVPDVMYVPLSVIVCGAAVKVQVQVLLPEQCPDWMVEGSCAMACWNA